MKTFVYSIFGVITICYPSPTYYTSITSGNPLLCQQAGETRANAIDFLYEYGMGTQQYIMARVVTVPQMGSLLS